MKSLRVVVAPTAFKGTLSPAQAADAIARGLRAARPDIECVQLPISDGGDGFLTCLSGALAAIRRQVIARGPLHSPVAVPYAVRAGDGLAVIETALSCGMALLSPDQLDPLGASTGGVGEVMAEAAQQGARTFLLGVGGSAATDGGTGMARALGYRFLNAAGHELAEGGGYLRALDRIDTAAFDPVWHARTITVACDVDNPLLGPAGSARVYAPQKGASPADVEVLEAGLRRLVEIVKRDLGVDMTAGSGGGLAAGLSAFLGAELRPGAELVLEMLGFMDKLAGVSALITGEGRLDRQSLNDKAPVVAGRAARRAGVKSIALVGSTGEGWEASLGDAFDQVVPIVPGGTPASEAMAKASSLLESAAGYFSRSL